jgi:hypothetical protein
MKLLAAEGFLSLAQAMNKFGVGRTTLYFWERRGLLTLKRFPVGRPRVFVNEAELTALLGGQVPVIASHAQPQKATRKSVALPAADPFFALAAQKTGITDLAEEHDHYAYGTEKRRRAKK